MPARNRDAESDSVDIKGRGATLAELKQNIIATAAPFFGVEADSATLTTGAIHAHVHTRTMDGTPLRYEAEVRVYFRPTILGATNAPDAHSWSADSDEVDIPVRRPIGPLASADFDEDEDDDGDDDDEDLD